MDNGDGIEKDDLALAVTRHATSKLQSLSELENIISLGFRGEALASISAVSKLALKSKPAEQPQAWMIDTGTESDFANYSAEPEPTSYLNGSSIEVRDLFYNTPARRKFMRTVKTEFKQIDEIVKRIALSQFNIAFKLSHNNKIIRQLPKAVTEKAINQRISRLFSADFLSHTHKVDEQSNHFSDIGKLRLWGWISTSEWCRTQTDWQYFYVNGRYIKDKLVNHALRQAYQDLLPADSYAAYILYLEIDPQQVDVNVHPTKHEVRFRQTRLVHDFIYSTLNQLINEPFSNNVNTRPADAEPSSHITDSYYYQTPHNSLAKPVQQGHVAEQIDGLQQLYQMDMADPSAQTDSLEKPEYSVQQTADILHSASSVSFFGQSLGCLIPHYLFTQKVQKNRVFIIDIHQAQQFLFKQLFKPGQTRPLLIPESLSLSKQDVDCLVQCQSELSAWGLDLSQLGDDSILIRSLPSLYEVPACTINAAILTDSIISYISQADTMIDVSGFLSCVISSIIPEILSTADQKQLLALLSQQIDSQEIQKKEQAVWVILDESVLDNMFSTGNR